MNKTVWWLALAAGAGLWLGSPLGLGAASSGADFLKVDIAADACAVGGNGLAALRPSTVAAYNPALLSGTTNTSLAFSMLPWIGDTLFSSLTVVDPQAKFPGVVLGCQVVFFTPFSIQSLDAGGYDNGDRGLFDLAVSVFGSYDLGGGLSVGAALRFLVRDVLDYSVFGIAGDAAVAWRVSFLSFSGPADRNLTLGLALRNLGPNLRFSELPTVARYANRLPTSVDAGLRYRFLKGEASEAWVAVEAGAYIYEGERRYRVAWGWTPFPILTVRAGYQNGAELVGLTFGFGLELPVAGGMSFDYALLPLAGGITPVHAASVSLRF